MHRFCDVICWKVQSGWHLNLLYNNIWLLLSWVATCWMIDWLIFFSNRFSAKVVQILSSVWGNDYCLLYLKKSQISSDDATEISDCTQQKAMNCINCNLALQECKFASRPRGQPFVWSAASRFTTPCPRLTIGVTSKGRNVRRCMGLQEQPEMLLGNIEIIHVCGNALSK